MKVAAVRVKNYRTIRNEIAFDVPSLLSIVGPNNAGKSNIARAIEIFLRVKKDPVMILALIYRLAQLKKRQV